MWWGMKNRRKMWWEPHKCRYEIVRWEGSQMDLVESDVD